jgi:cyclopropane fatty-acyl-phospholipid synthase-like methyltransferase
MAVFDALYKNVGEYFGREPDALLTRFEREIGAGSRAPRAGSRVLDIGAGQGRHALYLARRGHPVDCVETSAVAVEQLRERASKEHLPVRAFPVDFETYSPDVEYYPVILLFGLIQELPADSIGRLMERIDAWTGTGSLALVTAFTMDDPGYSEVSRTWREIGKNSFVSEAGFVRTFLEKNELRSLFNGWEAPHYWEGLGPEHRHGSDPPHRHGRVEAAFRKTAPQVKPSGH